MLCSFSNLMVFFVACRTWQCVENHHMSAEIHQCLSFLSFFGARRTCFSHRLLKDDFSGLLILPRAGLPGPGGSR